MATAMVQHVPLSEAVGLVGFKSTVSVEAEPPSYEISESDMGSSDSPPPGLHNSLSTTAISSWVRSMMEPTSPTSPSGSPRYHPVLSSVATSLRSMSSIARSRFSGSSVTSYHSMPWATSSLSTQSIADVDESRFADYVAAPAYGVSIAVLEDLKDALDLSDLSECWSDMAGVLLWVALTAGAASHKIDDYALKKWFRALAVRTSLLLCFEHPEAIHATYLKMSRIVEALSSSGGEDVVDNLPDGSKAAGKRKRI
jgi:hypothetical protein